MSKPPPPATCRLYLITPPSLGDLPAFAGQLSGALEAGDVAALQIRLKPAADEAIAAAVEQLRPIAHRHGVAVILNDRPDLAARLGCDGVHIGQSDMKLRQARQLMGQGAMIGVTCHDSRHLAMEASEEGADYVAFGAFYPTDTKETVHRPEPDILTVWQQTMATPCVAIGGITTGNAVLLAAAGADFLAVSAGVWRFDTGPAAAVEALNREIAKGLSQRA